MENPKGFMQFISFCIVGISNTLLSLIIYSSMIYVGSNYLVANLIAWLLSVYNAYYWNSKYVFQNKGHWSKNLLKTYVAYMLSFITSCVFLCFFVEYMNWGKIKAQLLTLALTVPMNFIINKFWTFK